MVDFESLLSALYEIQGAADPNHPASSLKERMDEVFEIASDLLARSGWHPDADHVALDDC